METMARQIQNSVVPEISNVKGQERRFDHQEDATYFLFQFLPFNPAEHHFAISVSP